MWKNLTYKRQVLVVVGGFALLLVLAYVMVFSKTVHLGREVETKQIKIAWLKEKEKEIPLLQSQMNLLDKAYNTGDSGSIRNKLTSFISDFAEKHGCLVTEIPKKSYFSGSQLNVQTNKFVIKGNFNRLLLLLNTLEKSYQYTARVASAKFYSTRNQQNKQVDLYLLVVTQSFRQRDNS